MNNRNHRTQEELRKELMDASKMLIEGRVGDSLGVAVANLFPNLIKVFPLRWIPEQGEDIHWLLIARNRIVGIEIPRNGEPGRLFRDLTVPEFQRLPLARAVQRRLDVAMQLI